MTALCSQANNQTEAHISHVKRTIFLFVCALLFVAAMLPSVLLARSISDQSAYLLTSADLVVDSTCSPYGSLVACVQIDTSSK